MARIVVVAGLASSLINFRGPLLAEMRARGHEIIALAPTPEPADPGLLEALRARGIAWHPIPLRRAGMNPLADLATFRTLVALLREHRPDLVFAYTIKAVIYGLLAARRAGVARRAALITGLGWAFSGESLRARAAGRAATMLYRRALAGAEMVFFQNPDDERCFRGLGILAPAAPTRVVAGSGVDLAAFPAAPPARGTDFLLIARLLRDKGILEYVAAARALRARFPAARFRLIGPLDPNPTGLSREQIDGWQREGVVEWLGEVADVRPHLAEAAVYVLPSWREGTPRTVLEAMASGRAVITTDAPGCRETIRDGIEGCLVPVRDPQALTAAMTRFLTDPALAAAMGAKARLRAEQVYDVNKVNAAMLEGMGLGAARDADGPGPSRGWQDSQ